MKYLNYYHTFNTPKKREYINITQLVRDKVTESGISEGFALVSAMHITSSVFINDNERGLIEDIEEWLQKLAPEGPEYRHHMTGEVNGDAHLKNLLLHHQVVVPVTDGELDFGPWQEVFYAEFDGGRPKRMLIKVIGQ